MNEIREAIKITDGKPVYCCQLIQGENNKMQLSIYRGEIHFESNNYSFNNYVVFNMCDEAHQLAKEMFLSSLEVCVKNKILELKQLEVILDELGLKSVIRGTIEENAPRLSVGKRILSALKGE